MSFRTLASPLALATALALSSTAFAQTMVGDQEISEADMPAVTEHCEMLATEAPAAGDAAAGGAAAGDAAGDAAAGGAAAGGDAAAAGDAAAGDTMAADTTAEGDAAAGAETTDPMAEGGAAAGGETTLDLEAITLEDCEAAGITMP